MIGRVATDGKHLSVDGHPFRVKGVTYGSFLPRLSGEPFPERWRVKSDFEAIANSGLNTVRTYSLPPPDVLGIAAEAGLRLIVGLHYDDWRMELEPGRRSTRRVLESGHRAVAAAIERCARRPEVLALSVGNEVPGDVVRLHGVNRVQDALSALVAEVHRGDPEVMVTYTSYPTTEYLAVEGLDLVTFNVFLEDPDSLRAYLNRLLVVAGERPVVLTELGLASEIHGTDEQAASLEWQLRTVDEAGLAGATVFAWTDEWGVAGEAVTGWGFGLTTAEREPKPAMAVVNAWAASSLRDLRPSWPRVSAVVCAYNEAPHIERSLASLVASDYPNLEILCCDDGSTDDTVTLARAVDGPVRILELPHGGLGTARNAGIDAATGEIVAFLDADAWAHPEWPYHLAMAFETPNVAAAGGPNLPDPDAGLAERAVTHSPGGPVEVLLTDDRAEHVPGCNSAFRREELLAIGGYDPAFTAAGDDVDVCWKLLDRGREIAFSPAAQVRHHRRKTVRGYLGQQRGYGTAERMVSGRHPHRFNRLGQARWSGFIYGGAGLLPSLLKPVIYHGWMGVASYQGVVRRPSERALAWAAALLPFGIPLAVLGSALAVLSPWWLLVPAVLAGATGVYAVSAARSAPLAWNEPQPFKVRVVIGWLHVAQPVVRAWGRLRASPIPPLAIDDPLWQGDRKAWLTELDRRLSADGCRVGFGQPGDEWDLRVTVGPMMQGRILTAVTWGWTPRWRLSLRPPAFTLAAGLAIAVALFVAAPWGWAVAVLGLMTASATVEASVIRRVVRRAMAATTRGAR